MMPLEHDAAELLGLAADYSDAGHERLAKACRTAAARLLAAAEALRQLGAELDLHERPPALRLIRGGRK